MIFHIQNGDVGPPSLFTSFPFSEITKYWRQQWPLGFGGCGWHVTNDFKTFDTNGFEQSKHNWFKMNIVRLHQLWESVINALMQACSTFMVSETTHYVLVTGYWFWLTLQGAPPAPPAHTIRFSLTCSVWFNFSKQLLLWTIGTTVLCSLSVEVSPTPVIPQPEI